MGAFHEGHLALIRAARAECETVVVSVFVNPAQFGAGEDFERYPRDEERDVRRWPSRRGRTPLRAGRDELYPAGLPDLGRRRASSARVLEGEHRPGHFRGVATVCLKLFNIVRPDRAYFGQKDAQQVGRRAADGARPELDVEIRVVPTVRDADGLALSSRNAYLSPEERERALALPRALATRDPERARELLERPRRRLRRGRRLRAERARSRRPRRQTRLIDNVVLEGDAA